VPHDASLPALWGLWPVFLSYVLSFVYIGIYWNNHHHMLHVTQRVTGAILWANLHLLFWLSLLPFSTGWMGENEFDRWPTVVYGVNLLACALAYFLLERRIIVVEGPSGKLAEAVGSDLSHVTHINIFLKDMSDFEAMNAAYVEIMGDRRPARTAISVQDLPKPGALLTMNLTAVTKAR